MKNDFNWNPRAQQPHRPMGKWERNKEYVRHIDDHARMLWYALKALPGVIGCYRKRLEKLYPAPFDLPEGFGLSTAPEPRLLEKMAEEIPSLDADCVLLRIHVWDLDNLKICRDFLLEMRDKGMQTMVAVLQDRRSVIDPDYWKEALERIFTGLAGAAGHFEIGHAWNRMKWGVRSFEQYIDLVEAAEKVKADYPDIRLAGPAVIDFEYLQTMGVLLHPKRAPRFDAVSSLLYVDRRGAPENRQYGFDLVHKALLMRAVADASLGEEVPFWITEANWPLAVPGEYSPTSMTESVGEELYADYMVRYFLLALTTGAVERVFWWQVAAHGYGMIDDLDGKWVRRPAWRSFRTMTSLLKGSSVTSVRSEPLFRALTFTSGDRFITAAWAVAVGAEMEPDFPVESVISRDGEALTPRDKNRIILGSSPVYIIHQQ